MSPARCRWLLAAVSLAAVALWASRTELQLIVADEIIYVVGARNLLERGSLDTNFYVPFSLLHQGHPHRDVHMPGYLFLLAPFVALLGPGIAAAVALNALLLLACSLLSFEIGRSLSPQPAALAAALLLLAMPPFTGYLFVGLPELAVAAFLLAVLRSAQGVRSAFGAVACGACFGAGVLLRESVLLALPVFAALLPARRLLTGFLPAAAAAAGLTLALFGPGRAQLGNRLYPAVLFESLRSSHPVAALAEALWSNAVFNLGRLAALRPGERSEDAVLVLLAALVVASAAGALARLSGAARRLALASVAAVAISLAASVLAYAVRDAGRPWAAARLLMVFTPLLLLAVTGTLWRLGSPALRGLGLGALLAAGVALSLGQLRFIDQDWKGRDRRDSERFLRHAAPWLDPLHPTRVAVRSNHAFLYGLTRYPVEVIWPIRSFEELAALEPLIGFDALVVPRGEPMWAYLEGNARYRHVNVHDPGGEFYVWQRLY